MNNIRRKQINEMINKINFLKSEIGNILSDEQDYYDNMPENLQGSDRGINSEEAIENLEEAINNIDEALSRLEDSKI